MYEGIGGSVSSGKGRCGHLGYCGNISCGVGDSVIEATKWYKSVRGLRDVTQNTWPKLGITMMYYTAGHSDNPL